MTLEEAKDKLRRNKHLIGKIHDKNKIAYLTILPREESRLKDIVSCIIYGKSYSDILNSYNDFDVIVMGSLDNFYTTGFLFWDIIDNLPKELVK